MARIASPSFGDQIEDKLVILRALFFIIIQANWVYFEKEKINEMIISYTMFFSFLVYYMLCCT